MFVPVSSHRHAFIEHAVSCVALNTASIINIKYHQVLIFKTQHTRSTALRWRARRQQIAPGIAQSAFPAQNTPAMRLYQ
jgi:hypothetical protein